MKFEFILDKNGEASVVKISYRDGRPDAVANRTR